MSAKALFNQLLDSGIIGASGETYFELHGLKTQVRDSSIVGNVIQEWLKLFMANNKIPYRLKQNSQEFPDFLMHATRHDIDLLEVKCFKKSPNFDVANFSAYCRSLLSHPYRLDSDYLIIEYQENNDGSILIKRAWLKKVWQICSGSERAQIKAQWKQGTPVNIRPATFYSNKAKYQPFQTRKEFVQALKTIIDVNPTMNHIQKDWFNKVSELYRAQTGNDI
ncbi:MAG: NgoBV family restriction endonuclease [Methylophilaceae bacterium]